MSDLDERDRSASEQSGESLPHLQALLFCELAVHMIPPLHQSGQDGRAVLAGVITRIELPTGTLTLPPLSVYMQFWNAPRPFQLTLEWRREGVSLYRIFVPIEPDLTREPGPSLEVLSGDFAVPLAGPGWYELGAIIGDTQLGFAPLLVVMGDYPAPVILRTLKDLQALEPYREERFPHAREPRCPYCQHVHVEATGGGGESAGGSRVEGYRCLACGQRFTVDNFG